MASSGLAPLQQIVTQIVPAAAQAADADTVVFVGPYAGTVTSVLYIADTAITGADTHTRKVSLVNKGADAQGTDEMAAIQFNNTVDAVAFVPKALTNGTAAKRAFDAGDVIVWSSLHVGNGLADPGGTVQVTFTRD